MTMLLRQLVVGLVLLVGTVVAVVGFNRAAAPTLRQPPPRDATLPDYDALAARLDASAVAAHHRAITAVGNRFTGSDGAAAAGTYIADTLRNAGFEVIRQPVPVTVPVTRHARLLDADGRVIDGVTVQPLLPNWFRTATTTGDNAVRGRVVRGTEGLAWEFEDVDLRGRIVLLPLGAPWETVARLGAVAVLYHDTDTAVRHDWPHHVRASVNLPRARVVGSIESVDRLVGRDVTLDVRVDMQQREGFNVVGIRRASSDTREVVVMSADYDAYSYVPDAAPGHEAAVSAAALLAAAQAMDAGNEQSRHAVVVFTVGRGMALAGARRFAAAVGLRGESDHASALQARAAESRQRYVVLQAAATQSEQDEALMRRAMAVWLLERYEAMEAARVAWVRAGMPATVGGDGTASPQDDTFSHYQQARDALGRAEALGRQDLADIVQQADEHEGDTLRPHIEAARRAMLEEAKLDAARAEADAAIAELFAEASVLHVGLDLTRDTVGLKLVCGEGRLRTRTQPADGEVMTQLQTAAEALGIGAEDELTWTNAVRGRDAGALAFVRQDLGAPMYFGSLALLHGGHASFSLVSDGQRGAMGTPADRFDMPEAADGNAAAWERVASVAKVMAAALEQIARGQGRFVAIGLTPDAVTVRGRVVSQLGDNLVPSHPMGGALVRFDAVPAFSRLRNQPAGVGSDLVATARSDGTFALEHVWGTGLSSEWIATLQMDAAVVDAASGAVRWTLSEPMSGSTGTYRARGVPLSQMAGSLATLVVFRSAPLQVFPMPDPRTLKPFAGVGFLSRRTLAQPGDYKIERDDGGITVCHVPQAERMLITFRQGLPEAPQRLVTVAFALNMSGEAAEADGVEPSSDRALAGAGFEPGDSMLVRNVEVDAAASMAAVNSGRIQRQAQRGLADGLLVRYAEQATALSQQADAAMQAGQPAAAQQAAWQSLAYSTAAYPWAQRNTTDAIWGIVFYLFLAIPFVIFLEKLLIGTPDLRKQLAWVGGFFVAFFLLLSVLHPAYELVRSPYVILLGFVTLALALFVGGFVAARFSRNVTRALKQSQQQVEAADVSRASAAATAFALGLNNLRRRPMRTGLTMMTLVCITFVMVAFTSVRTDVVDQRVPVGQASYAGLLVRDPALANVANQLGPLREMYGQDYVVAPRGWHGSFDAMPGRLVEPAQLSVVATQGDERVQATAAALLGLTVGEIKLLPLRETAAVWTRWFERDDEPACLLPTAMAAQLRLDPAAIEAGEAMVTIAGRELRVLGTFDEAAMERLVDLDGQSILPLDVRALGGDASMAQAGATDTVTAPPRVQRLPAEQVVITSFGSLPGRPRVASIAVGLPRDMPYAQQRELIVSHLERSGSMTCYGLDGVAYLGARMRSSSFTGLIDMLLPILIAALTVLNTMYGSVYERRDELYVFNSVGLAPNHVRWLFFAEALVYAVVGVVGGYLLAQAVSFVLRAMDLTAGLSMNYSSLTGVFVSVTIMAVVLASSLLPARLASKLATPAESMARKREGGEGDTLRIDLPFTFNRRDTVAIVPYFADWFEEFGESSAGAFSAGRPTMGLFADAQGKACPIVSTTTWLKPFDLGVSQRVELTVQPSTDSDDRVAVVTITRLSGDRDNWQRCCHRFLGLLRRRLLTWRGVSLDQRQQLHDRARAMLDPREPSPADTEVTHRA